MVSSALLTTPLEIVPQDLRPAQHRVQRRSKLVRQDGKEFLLRPVRALEIGACRTLAREQLGSFPFGAPLLPEVLQDEDDEIRLVRFDKRDAGADRNESSLTLGPLELDAESARRRPCCGSCTREGGPVDGRSQRGRTCRRGAPISSPAPWPKRSSAGRFARTIRPEGSHARIGSGEASTKLRMSRNDDVLGSVRLPSERG
jgi:hypothetical protein